MALTLTALHRYPVKSCRGESLSCAVVEPWGLSGDRRWMIVDAAGDVVTAREHPQLVLVRPDIVADGLRVSRPGVDPLQISAPRGVDSDEVRVWDNPVRAVAAAPEAHAWFSAVVGKPVRLVYLDDPTGRAPNPLFAQPHDRVSFADGYPVHVTTAASLDALNELIAAGPLAEQGPLPMMRFRPNLVVDGSTAWAEDGWRRLRVGDAIFRAVKGCDRCVLTTVDPDTAVKGKEPVATLARHRKWDGKVWFGMDLIPDTPGALLHVGDDVEILESVESDGPPR